MSRTLRAVAQPGLTAAEAISWWGSAPRRPAGAELAGAEPTGRGMPVDDAASGTPVGFGLATRTASWWRIIDGVPVTRKGRADLTGVYELVGFDGDRELRWRNDDGGRGTGVVLADLPGLLPPGDREVSPKDREASPKGKDEATPFGDPQPRILAGQVHRIGDSDWVRLTAARYAPAEIPVVPDPDFDLDGMGENTPAVVLDSLEYAVEDRHGNVSVVDRRLVRLRIVTHQQLRFDLTREG